MTPDTNNATPHEPRGFPFVTVAATLATLLVFVFLTWLAAHRPNPLETPKPEASEKQEEPKPDAAARLDEVKARNQAALDGVGAKMSLRDAHGQLMSKLKGPNDKLPFPTPEPPAPAPPKKDEKKDGKEKP
jgi:hypothetical protein